MTNDIAFKVIIKNDGISDIIFKTLMLKGEAGGTISSIEKTSSVGDVDTYTITLNDGTTSTFEVTNGSNIDSIEKTATAGLIDTYTVTLTNGDTSTFEVKNGEDAQLYELPADAVVGYDHEPTQVTETSYERYIQLDDVNGISSVKYNGNTLQETNDGRNLFDINLLDKPDITINDNEVSATTSTFNSYFLNGVFPSTLPNNQYALSFKAYTDGNASTTGYGLMFGFRYSDNTISYASVLNSVNSYESFSAISDSSKTVENVFISYGTNGANVWHLKDIQLEKGSQATPYQPYCGGIPSPNPDYPQEIVGVGEKQQDNTYSVDLVAEDSDGNVYTVTASGLSHPVYSGDWIDLVAGVLHRGMKVVKMSDLTWSYNNTSYSYGFFYLPTAISDKAFNTIAKSNYFINRGNSRDHLADGELGFYNTSSSSRQICIRCDSITSLSDWETWIANNDSVIVYNLATPTEENITLTGDLEQVKRMRGEYIYIDAPLYVGTTEITFGQETDFPDGYEEIDFPLDDMFYYQDGDEIYFPVSWGFVNGYVFDDDEIRLTMNLSKMMKDDIVARANRSLDLSLDIYTGSGGGSLTGFNSIEAEYIKSLGQIQIRLKTENPHGLASGSLLGARVNRGVMTVFFERRAQ